MRFQESKTHRKYLQESIARTSSDWFMAQQSSSGKSE